MLLLAVLGWFRGLVAQVASVLALAAGLWLGAWVEQWVGARWLGAHPAVIFGMLKWLIAVGAALAATTLLIQAGDALGRRVQDGSVAWADRAFGVPAGATIGLALAGVMTLAMVSLPVGRAVQHAVATARSPRWLLVAGERACAAGGTFPGAHATERRFVTARHRLAQLDRSKT